MQVQCPLLEPFIKPNYSLSELNELEKTLEPALSFDLSPQGLLQAAARNVGENEFDPTHYDAVWVRDACWGVLALQTHQPDDALKLLRSLWKYFATPAQLHRLRNAIQNPYQVVREDGAMNAIHIRFDAHTFDDVFSGGERQRWSHKQNDALGFFYQLAVEAVMSGQIPWASLDESEKTFFVQLPRYFEKVNYATMQDSGAWEEIERVNSSSVGLVVSSLETLASAMEQEDFRTQWNKVEDAFPGELLTGLIDQGYQTLRRQLPFESPLYPTNSSRYREADAALLNLIYPCRLSRLSTEDLEKVWDQVQRLVGEKGVKRYFDDAYQAAGYWVVSSESSDLDSRTDDHSGVEQFEARARAFQGGTEAEWFFDSWLSACAGVLLRRTGKATYVHARAHHLHRALAQVTPDSDPPLFGADGKPTPKFCLPESYNVAITDGKKVFLPSPIAPLNWAKCSLRLALHHWKSFF